MWTRQSCPKGSLLQEEVRDVQGYGTGHLELEFRATRLAGAARHRACPCRLAVAGPLPPGSLIDSLHGYCTQPPADPFANLTPRKRQIVAVTIEWNGAPNKCLTDLFGFSESTLRNAQSRRPRRSAVSDVTGQHQYGTDVMSNK